MSGSSRKRVSYSLRVEELLLAKLAALLHDPPWKPWSITGILKRLEDEMRLLEPLTRCSWAKRINFGKKAHEKQAKMLAGALFCVLEACCISSEHYDDTIEGLLNSVPKGADIVASGFDRIVAALAELGYHGRLGTAVVGELFNPFRPSLLWRCSLDRGKRYDAFKCCLLRFTWEMFKRLWRACSCGGLGDRVSRIRRMYHVFSVL